MLKSIIGICFDCRDAKVLGDFYYKLTGWVKEIEGKEFVALRTPEDILLVFQTVENFIPPVWPSDNENQQQMAHIDFFVDNLIETEELAIKLGAKKSEIQFYEDSTVMLDPAGHPFCISTIKQ